MIRYTTSYGSQAYWDSLFLLALLASGSLPPTSLSGLNVGLLGLFLLILLFTLGLIIVLVSKIQASIEQRLITHFSSGSIKSALLTNGLEALQISLGLVGLALGC